jgi:uncharacterized protein
MNLISPGQTALITGASSGIGEAFARRFAAEGMRLVLVARSLDKLEKLAAELRSAHQTEVVVGSVDLFAPDAADQLEALVATTGWDLDVLVNNAGMGIHGRFTEAEYAKQRSEIMLNVVALVDATERFVKPMVGRGRGLVINVASTAALQPLPFMAIYGATKAFVLSFGEALAEELSGTGVLVHTVCPGNTETPFHAKVGEKDGRVGASRTPDQVVETCVAAVRRGKPMAIDGLMNRLLAVLPRILPRRMTTRVSGNLMRKGL